MEFPEFGVKVDGSPRVFSAEFLDLPGWAEGCGFTHFIMPGAIARCGRSCPGSGIALALA
ncbi:MAG TPA: hypothetical protein VEZ50_04980 [Nodosilinea sp.]|nr:hypothetical protein [Nodosilinea sp.]